MKRFLSLALCFIAIFTVSCSSKYSERVIYGMDSYNTIRVGGNVSDDKFDEFSEYCSYIIGKNQRLMSNGDTQAQIYAFNCEIDKILYPNSDLVSVLNTAAELSKVTGGVYTHTIGALTSLWREKTPTEEEIANALEHISPDGLSVSDEKIEKTDDALQVDLCGIEDGYTVQEIVEYLARNVDYGIVSIGESVGVFGSKDNGESFKIGIYNPRDTENIFVYFNINSGFISVAGSSLNEKNERKHEIIDPSTGYPASSGIIATAVWTQNGCVSDALSEAVYIMGIEKTFELYNSGKVDFEAMLVTESGEVILTGGLNSDVFELVSEDYSLKAR